LYGTVIPGNGEKSGSANNSSAKDNNRIYMINFKIAEMTIGRKM
jgi:hypothetical protein